MGHQHDHGHAVGSEKSLIITLFLNLLITVTEIIGGLLSGSLSLLSDALHNLSDAFSVLISYFALKLSRKENDAQMTFGYKRAEILAALFNAVVLIAISLFLFREAYVKFLRPEPVQSGLMIAVGLIGLAANTFSVFLLQRGAKESMNIRSAYVHLLSDAVSSVGVVVGGIIIYAYQVYWVDPLLTVLIGLYIIKESWEIISKAVHILLQGTPENIDINQIEQELAQLPTVRNIHHVHVWQTNDADIHFEAHVNLAKDLLVSQAAQVSHQIEETLHHSFDIEHVTLQLEYDCCPDVGLVKKRRSE